MAAFSTLAAIGLGLSALGTGVQVKMAADARSDAQDAQKKQDAQNQKMLADKTQQDEAASQQKRQAAMADAERAKLAGQRVSMGNKGGTLLTSPLGVTTDYTGAGGKTALGS